MVQRHVEKGFLVVVCLIMVREEKGWIELLLLMYIPLMGTQDVQ